MDRFLKTHINTENCALLLSTNNSRGRETFLVAKKEFKVVKYSLVSNVSRYFSYPILQLKTLTTMLNLRELFKLFAKFSLTSEVYLEPCQASKTKKQNLPS